MRPILVLTALIALLLPGAARADGPTPYVAPPFAGDCTVHHVGEGEAPDLNGYPDDPLCVAYAKRDITLDNGGAVAFLLAEPSRFAIAPLSELESLHRKLDRPDSRTPTGRAVRTSRWAERYATVRHDLDARVLRALRPTDWGVDFTSPPPVGLARTPDDDLATVRSTPRLIAREQVERALALTGPVDDDVRDVLDRLRPRLAPWTRCPACNGLLAPVAKAAVAPVLRPGTRRTYQTFSGCRNELGLRGVRLGGQSGCSDRPIHPGGDHADVGRYLR